MIIARMKVDDDETFPTENEGEDEQKEQVFKDSKTFLKVSLWLPKGHGLMSILSDPLNMDLNIQAKHMMLVSFQNLHWQNELNLRYSIFLHKN